MIRLLLAACAALTLSFDAATAATFEYPIKIDAITGDGEAMNIGFFSTGSVGDLGTGKARTDADFPSSVPMQFNDNSIFQAIFPGVASAASFFANPVVQDAAAGTVKVSGFLGGVTGPYSEFLSAGAFEFVYKGASGAEFSSLADYETFLATATMSGFLEGIFTVEGGIDDQEILLKQRIDFSDATPVPLPAGAVLLLSGLGLLMVRRRAQPS